MFDGDLKQLCDFVFLPLLSFASVLDAHSAQAGAPGPSIEWVQQRFKCLHTPLQ